MPARSAGMAPPVLPTASPGLSTAQAPANLAGIDGAVFAVGIRRRSRLRRLLGNRNGLRGFSTTSPETPQEALPAEGEAANAWQGEKR